MVWLKDERRELTRSGFKELVIWFKVQGSRFKHCTCLSVINIAYKE